MIKLTEINKENEETRVMSGEETEMMVAGVHLGHKTSRLHPRMEKYIVGIRNTVHILDLEATKKYLDEALRFIEKTVKEGGVILFVGTKLPFHNLIKETAMDCSMPFVAERWLGGTFTNFLIIKKRIERYKELKKLKSDGAFEKYTKKEQIVKEKEIKDLERKFGGIATLDKIPEVVFIADLLKDDSCFREAKNKGVKVVSIVDTNVDPLLVDFPIPGNDGALTSVGYILNRIKDAILSVKNN